MSKTARQHWPFQRLWLEWYKHLRLRLRPSRLCLSLGSSVACYFTWYDALAICHHITTDRDHEKEIYLQYKYCLIHFCDITMYIPLQKHFLTPSLHLMYTHHPHQDEGGRVWWARQGYFQQGRVLTVLQGYGWGAKFLVFSRKVNFSIKKEFNNFSK